jgi:UDPglucose--hexose-1-phosphate uridylyltransferase
MRNNKKFPSELRLDVNSKNWVVIATGRAKRPETFKSKKKRVVSSKKDCPFCDIKKQGDPILVYSRGKKQDQIKNWSTVVIPNKFPAFIRSDKLERKKENGLFERMNAVGSHEVVVTRDHNKSLALLPQSHVKEVIDVYTDRFKSLINEDKINYVAIFHNHGPEAGASIDHPHSQIIGIPLIDSDLEGALRRAKKYSQTKECIYCEMNKWEIKKKTRIVHQNKDFIAVCPYASRSAFQVIISPRKHLSFFEKITEKEKVNLAEIFKVVLAKLHKALGDTPYNFYLHSAPSDGKNHSYYHWHWTILPKTSIWAGFELGVGIEISTIEPEKAAQYLRKQKI